MNAYEKIYALSQPALLEDKAFPSKVFQAIYFTGGL